MKRLIPVLGLLVVLAAGLAGYRQLSADGPAGAVPEGSPEVKVGRSTGSDPPVILRQVPSPPPSPVGRVPAAEIAPENPAPDNALTRLARRRPDLAASLRASVTPLAVALVQDSRPCFRKRPLDYSLVQYDFQVDVQPQSISLSDITVQVRQGAPLPEDVVACVREAAAAGRTGARDNAAELAELETDKFRSQWTIEVGARSASR